MTRLCKFLSVVAMLAIGGNGILNAQLAEFCEDFESVDPESPTAISDIGYEVFASVFENGKFIGGGGGPAPNGGNGFSSIVTDVGGDMFSLNIFSDYDSAVHNEPTQTLEANVFIVQIPAAADVGSTWTYSFDFRAADEGLGPADGATATAFVRIINSVTFFLDAEFLVDTTNATMDFENGSIEVEIVPEMEGNFLQFGFNNLAGNFEPTGVYYDNISFKPATGFLLGDVNGDGEVNLLDVAPFVDLISTGGFSEAADINMDGMVNLLDVGPFVALLSGG